MNQFKQTKMDEKNNQIFLKFKQIEKKHLELLGAQLEDICESKPLNYKGKCLLVHPTSLDMKNFLGKGIIIFLDKSNISQLYNKVFSFGPYTNATHNPHAGEYSAFMDISKFKGDPTNLFLSESFIPPSNIWLTLYVDTKNYSIKGSINLESMLYTSRSYPNIHFLLTKEAILRDSKVSTEKRISNTLFLIGRGSSPEELKQLREEVDGWVSNVLDFDCRKNTEPHSIENVLKYLI